MIEFPSTEEYLSDYKLRIGQVVLNKKDRCRVVVIGCTQDGLISCIDLDFGQCDLTREEIQTSDNEVSQ